MCRRDRTYIFYEIGDSCRSEFKMRDGGFHHTEDAVVVGISDGRNPLDAYKRLQVESPWIKEYEFASVVAREVGKPIYL